MDGVTTDLALDADHDLPVYSRQVSGLDLLQQRLWLRLALHQGEVLSDRTKGLPWVPWLSTRPVPLALVRSRIRREVESCPGVLSVSDVTASIFSSRTLVVTLSVVGADGIGALDLRLSAESGGNLALGATVRRTGRVMSGTAVRA